MVYTASWRGVSAQRAWAAPTKNGLLTLQLVGDLHLQAPGVVWPDPTKDTVYDLLGRDMRDQLLRTRPDHILQMGDLAGGISTSYEEIISRFDLFNQWMGAYGQGIADWDIVVGNHDVPGYASEAQTVTAQQWAAYWGYPAPSYALDFGIVRVLVIGPTGVQGDPPSEGPFPVRPLTSADVAWIDRQLTIDRRPTLLAVHAPLNGAGGAVHTEWKEAQSTVAGGVDAVDLFEVLDAHPHCIGWVHGHTHSPWTDPNNTSTLDVGSRRIAVVDASAIFEKSDEFGGASRLPTTYYVTVLDDGRTLDVRWRSHYKRLWDSLDGVSRYVRLSAT